MFIDSGDAHDGCRPGVAREQHPTHTDPRRLTGVAQQAPAVAVVVLSVEVSDEVDLEAGPRLVRHGG